MTKEKIENYKAPDKRNKNWNICVERALENTCWKLLPRILDMTLVCGPKICRSYR